MEYLAMTIGPRPLYAMFTDLDGYAPVHLLHTDTAPDPDAPLDISDEPTAGDPLDISAPLPVGTCPGCGVATVGGETCPDCVLRW